MPPQTVIPRAALQAFLKAILSVNAISTLAPVPLQLGLEVLLAESVALSDDVPLQLGIDVVVVIEQGWVFSDDVPLQLGIDVVVV